MKTLSRGFEKIFKNPNLFQILMGYFFTPFMIGRGGMTMMILEDVLTSFVTGTLLLLLVILVIWSASFDEKEEENMI